MSYLVSLLTSYPIYSQNFSSLLVISFKREHTTELDLQNYKRFGLDGSGVK